MNSSKALFIVGVGRSGTSLLQSILGSHSDINVVPETSILRRYIFKKKIDFDSLKSDKLICRCKALKDILSNKVSTRLGILEAYKSALYLNNDSIYTLDKDPRLVEFIDMLPFLGIEHKIIVLVRDPRDVLVSKKNAAWSSDRSILNYLVASHAQLSDSRNLLQCKNTLLVYYENLLNDPVNELKLVCDFLDITFEIEMLDFQDTAKQLISDDELSWKKETLLPLNRNNFSKWKGKLTIFESYVSLLVAKNAFPELIFLQENNVGFLRKFFYLLISQFVYFVSFFYRFIRKQVQNSIKTELK